MNSRPPSETMTDADNLAHNPPPPIGSIFDAKRRDVAFNRFPLKHGWDALALGRVLSRRDISFEQRRACLKFYSTGNGIQNLFASLTRSGSHWSILGISLALDLAAGGDGEYLFDGGWYPSSGYRYLKLDWRAPLGEKALGRPSVNPVLFHTHHPYYRVRCARLKSMNIAIVLRSILESMESKFFKLAEIPDDPTNEDDSNFAWEKLVDDAIEFYNSWGDVIRWHPNCRVYRYEDLLANPADVHKQMTDFFGLDIPREVLVEAFGRITKEKMRGKFTAEELEQQRKVSYRDKDAKIPEKRKQMILERLDSKLVFNFGYEFKFSD